MGTGSLRKMALAAMLVLATLFGAHADDPVYITGAEYTIDGSRLTVTSGNGTLIAQTPSSVIEICVTNGASLKIGIDDPFGSTLSMYLFGKERDVGGYDFATLDLNGHSITIKNLDNRWRNQGYVPHPGPGQVVNTSSTAANVNISSATVSSYFFGNFIEQPGKISVETTDTNFFVLPTVSPAPLSSLTMRDSAQLQIHTSGRDFANIKGSAVIMHTVGLSGSFHRCRLQRSQCVVGRKCAKRVRDDCRRSIQSGSFVQRFPCDRRIPHNSIFSRCHKCLHAKWLEGV